MYRTIEAAFWTDRTVKRTLTPNEKFVYVYLRTNSHTHASGLYYLPFLLAQDETGLSAPALRSARSGLEEKGLCKFDEANELVWVRPMFETQGYGRKKLMVSAAHHIQNDIRNSFLVNGFLEQYPLVREHLKAVSADTIPNFAIPEQSTREQVPEQNTDSDAQKRTGTPDPAYEFFAEGHRKKFGFGYQHKKADFIQLAELRKAFGLGGKETPGQWDKACGNYFESVLSKVSMADLCIRYAIFLASPIDRYSKPINTGETNGTRVANRNGSQLSKAPGYVPKQ